MALAGNATGRASGSGRRDSGQSQAGRPQAAAPGLDGSCRSFSVPSVSSVAKPLSFFLLRQPS